MIIEVTNVNNCVKNKKIMIILIGCY